jgi:hypothetical protein
MGVIRRFGNYRSVRLGLAVAYLISVAACSNFGLARLQG